MTPPTNSPLILVIEDEDALRQDIVEELQENGFRTLSARDGRAAVDLLMDHAPALVLCDVTMPDLDGFGVLRSLRKQHPELATTPFVFLTALADPSEVIEGKLLGADDYLVKPVDYDLMLATIHTRLKQVERIQCQHSEEIQALQSALRGSSDAGAMRALDLISHGIILLGRDGRLLQANSTAQEMAANGGPIVLGEDGVTSVDPLSDRTLQQAILASRSAVEAGHENITGVLLAEARGYGPISVLVCGLPTHDSASTSDPKVVLFLNASARKTRVSLGPLIDLYGLTPTEARVAAKLANGARPSEAATELGVSQTTISFHMRNLFQKTGTNRQADLIALLLAGPMLVKGITSSTE